MSGYQLGAGALVRFVALAALLVISLHSMAEPETVWIDVRSADEYAEAHLPAAVNIPHETIAEHIAQYAPDKQTPVVLYCRSGRRADVAKDSLEQLGYQRVVNAVDLDGATQMYQQHNVGAE